MTTKILVLDPHQQKFICLKFSWRKKTSKTKVIIF